MIMNLFIGELPPPYGGVAVKDKLVYQEVYKSAGVKMLNLVECKWKPYKTPIVGLKMLWGLLRAKHVIIGVGTNGRLKTIMKLRKFLRGKKGLQSTIMLAMGGKIQETTKTDIKLKNLLISSQSVWVETNGMKESFESQGFTNIRIFPNCRTDENSIEPQPVGDKIKYVYFSRICAEKGVDEIIKAFDKPDGNYTLDFYGEVASEFEEDFNAFLTAHPEIKYHGVFDSTNGNVYQELNQYDVMLLPTRWVGEGVPGALVEAKMSGITAIVSDWNFNAEIVIDGKEGIVLKKSLSDTIASVTPDKIMRLKNGAYNSRTRYCISTYKEMLLKDIE